MHEAKSPASGLWAVRTHSESVTPNISAVQALAPIVDRFQTRHSARRLHRAASLYADLGIHLGLGLVQGLVCEG